MAGETLQGMKVAILVTDGFEQVELTEPRKALDQAGAETHVVSPKGDEVRGWNFTDWGQSLPVDLKLDDARPQDFDALLLPGGVINPDKLRMIPAAVQFVKAFFDAGKPVAAICHGPWMIVEADKARGRRIPPGPRSGPICGTPERKWSIRKRSSTAIWSPAGNPMTSRPSAAR